MLATDVFNENGEVLADVNPYYTDLDWEVVNETNVGVSVEMFNSRLQADLDYYYRLTENAIISAKIPFSPHSLAGNYGEIENSGLEFSAN